MNEELKEAYRKTSYVAEGPEGERIVLRIGRGSDALDAVLAARNLDKWAFVTACNPRSALLPDDENERRCAELRRELEAAGREVWPGEGVGDSGDWKPEPSFLILGIERIRAVELGRRWEQNAIVLGRHGEPAELVDCFAAE
jgi:hypothetical protein